MDATHLSLEEINHQVQSDIKRYGWGIIASDCQGMIYANTIGLEANFNHPELETLGLSEELATAFLNQLAEWVKGGNRLKAGMQITELVEGYGFLLVSNPSQGTASPKERLRLIWPDINHCYPWDSNCDEECAKQTLIFENVEGNDENEI